MKFTYKIKGSDEKINPKNFKFVREYRGYNQTELAKNVKGLTQRQISDFEKGLIKLDYEKLKKAMIFMNWPIMFLTKRLSEIPKF